eukprot:1193638-Prorocentrum_minimum.AAC.4
MLRGMPCVPFLQVESTLVAVMMRTSCTLAASCRRCYSKGSWQCMNASGLTYEEGSQARS